MCAILNEITHESKSYVGNLYRRMVFWFKIKINTFSIHCFSWSFMISFFSSVETIRCRREKRDHFEVCERTHSRWYKENQRENERKQWKRKGDGHTSYLPQKKRQNQEKPWNILEIVVKALFWAAETKHTNQPIPYAWVFKTVFFVSSICLPIHETHITIYRIVEKKQLFFLSRLLCMCLMSWLRCIFSTLNHNQSCGHSFAMHKSAHSLLNAYCLCHQCTLRLCAFMHFK